MLPPQKKSPPCLIGECVQRPVCCFHTICVRFVFSKSEKTQRCCQCELEINWDLFCQSITLSNCKRPFCETEYFFLKKLVQKYSFCSETRFTAFTFWSFPAKVQLYLNPKPWKLNTPDKDLSFQNYVFFKSFLENFQMLHSLHRICCVMLRLANTLYATSSHTKFHQSICVSSWTYFVRSIFEEKLRTNTTYLDVQEHQGRVSVWNWKNV